MSTPRIPVDHRKGVIGCNLRRAMTPGGFSSRFQTGKGPINRAVYASQEDVNKAAREFMAKRGVVNEASAFERSARNYPRAST